MKDNIIDAFLLLEVQSRGSKPVVDIISEKYGEVKEAAAVYSEIDVVVHLSASEERLGEIIVELMKGEIIDYDENTHISDSYEIRIMEYLVVEGKISQKESESDLGVERDIYAYVIIDVLESQDTSTSVLRSLRDCEGILYYASLAKKKKQIIAKIKARSKNVFDHRIMYEVQSILGVSNTRSLLIINSMHYVKNSNSSEEKRLSASLEELAKGFINNTK